jgi:hypothetical protein
MMAMKMNLQFYMRTKKMSIKHKIKFKKIDRDRGTYFANGISLDLSDDGQPSDDSRRPSGESARRSVSQDDIEYQGGAAYKAILKLFANQLDDEKFAEHCKNFFKGKNDN